MSCQCLAYAVIMATMRAYGEIDGYPEGTAFPDRKSAHEAGVHPPTQGGISGGKDGADSVVVSGGYPDDQDLGDEIIYTGQGGRDEATGRQVTDQTLTLGNIGLVRSQFDGHDVRVIRGFGGDPQHSPASGYRYDGLFRVVDHWRETSRDGPLIWRFRLLKVTSGTPLIAATGQAGLDAPTPRSSVTGERLVRDAAVAKRVKDFHHHTCQVCSTRLMTAVGPYAEGAHIRGLGRPHEGPDTDSNMLCLCPNHHFLFDAGAIYIDEDWNVVDAQSDHPTGSLRLVATHKINPGHVRYHREHYVPPSID